MYYSVDKINKPLATARSLPPLSLGQLRISKRSSSKAGVLRIKNVDEPPPSRLIALYAPNAFKHCPNSSYDIPLE